MSREEAAANVLVRQTGDDPWTFGAPDKDVYLIDTREILEAADAHDRANGIHRVRLDDATAERAARGTWLQWDEADEASQREWSEIVRSVLAAAVKEEQA